MTLKNIRIIGAGFSGATAARVLAEQGASVEIWDKRPHIGGNAFDTQDAYGVTYHPYGPHIFHTNSDRVMSWLQRFSTWQPYEHRVLASVDEKLVPMPINRTTINQLYNLNLDEAGIQAFFDNVKEPYPHPQNSEQAVLSFVGRDLCDKLYRGYTLKQWGRDLSQLSASVVTRIPVRTNDDDRYFSDGHQCMPTNGYSALFKEILRHPNIDLRLDHPFDPSNVEHRQHCDALVYTGPIDAFFGHIHGPLPYRSLRFEHSHHPEQTFAQPVGVINHPNQHAYTRVTEWKHITGQSCNGTTLTREYPSDQGEPFYPVPSADAQALFTRYQAMAEALPNVTFIGRLAEYRYYNMDQAIASALSKADALAQQLQLTA